MMLGQFWLSVRTSFVAVTKPNEDIELKARRYAVDFLPHRARITVDVDLSQLPARFRLNPMDRVSEPLRVIAYQRQLATPVASTTASGPALP